MDGKPEFIFEVKRSLQTRTARNQARRQGFDYALQTGARFVVLTDADTYEIYDLQAGSDFDGMLQGRLQLTCYRLEDQSTLDLLRPKM